MSNYTIQETEQLIELYRKLGTPGIDKIVETLGKTKKSVIAKLSREKLYVKSDKSSSDRVTKKVLVRRLIELTGKELGGIEAADKQSLLDIIEHIEGINERIEEE